jgi:hypothetical protein
MITLTLVDPCWISDLEDDPGDQCAHGRVLFRVGETVFVKPEDGEWTVSGAALYLLRTLTVDNVAEHRVATENFLFPCCALQPGVGEEGSFAVEFVGCNTGMEVDIVHGGGRVRFCTPDGDAAEATEEEWTSAVLSFCRQVTHFYEGCSPKVDFGGREGEGWTLFWREWRERESIAMG